MTASPRRSVPAMLLPGLILGLLAPSACVTSTNRDQPAVDGRGGQTLHLRLDAAGRSGYRWLGETRFVAETADGTLPVEFRGGDRTQISFYRPGPLRVAVTKENGEHVVTNELRVEPGDEVILHVSDLGTCIARRSEWTGSCSRIEGG